MPIPLTLAERRSAKAAPLTGMWVCSGSPLVAEVCAGSGLDWLLIDGEHSPNSLPTVLAQLQAVASSPIATVVRPPIGDEVIIKQYLDLGVTGLLVPMVDTAEHAAAMAAAVAYPPAGTRGIGSALARSSRWGRDTDYLHTARAGITLLVQIESATAVGNVAAIAAVDGVDGVFLGPADLAGSMGLLGQQSHPDVVAAVEHCIEAGHAAGKLVGVNAFDPALARRYAAAGADLISVGADVTLLAQGSTALGSVLER